MIWNPLLQLGLALRDKSSIGRMRDSCPIQLFCCSNCVQCIAHGMMHEFMYLLVWTLQEENIRSSNPSREQHLLKLTLCFTILLHYFDLYETIQTLNLALLQDGNALFENCFGFLPWESMGDGRYCDRHMYHRQDELRCKHYALPRFLWVIHRGRDLVLEFLGRGGFRPCWAHAESAILTGVLDGRE